MIQHTNIMSVTMSRQKAIMMVLNMFTFFFSPIMWRMCLITDWLTNNRETLLTPTSLQLIDKLTETYIDIYYIAYVEYYIALYRRTSIFISASLFVPTLRLININLMDM